MAERSVGTLRPSFYTLHTFYFAEAHMQNCGNAQAMYSSPMRDAIDAGLRPTNHTDFVVAPLDQMMLLWSAVNRISRAGAEVGPDQCVTPYEGLTQGDRFQKAAHHEVCARRTQHFRRYQSPDGELRVGRQQRHPWFAG